MKKVVFAFLVAATLGWSSTVGPFTVNQASVVTGCATNEGPAALAIQVINSSGVVQGTQYLVQSNSPTYASALALTQSAMATGRKLYFEVLSNGTETVNYAFTAQTQGGQTCYTGSFYNVQSLVVK